MLQSVERLKRLYKLWNPIQVFNLGLLYAFFMFALPIYCHVLFVLASFLALHIWWQILIFSEEAQPDDDNNVPAAVSRGYRSRPRSSNIRQCVSSSDTNVSSLVGLSNQTKTSFLSHYLRGEKFDFSTLNLLPSHAGTKTKRR